MLDAAATSTPHIVAPHGVTAWDWIHAGIIIVVAFGAAQILRRLTGRALKDGADKPIVRIVERCVAYIILLAGFVYALEALKVKIGPLIGALGIGGIALAFALQDILQNMVAGIIIQARRPIRIGDQVDVGKDCNGTVRDIDLRTVLIRTFDGLDIYVPNKTVLENAMTNYTVTPNRRLKLEIGVAYGTDLREAQRRLVAAATSVDAVLDDPAPAAWVVSFDDSSVHLTLLFWFPVSATFWTVRSDVAMAVDEQFRAARIEMPYPQRTLSLDQETARLLAPTEPSAGNGDRHARSSRSNGSDWPSD